MSTLKKEHLGEEEEEGTRKKPRGFNSCYGEMWIVCERDRYEEDGGVGRY